MAVPKSARSTLHSEWSVTPHNIKFAFADVVDGEATFAESESTSRYSAQSRNIRTAYSSRMSTLSRVLGEMPQFELALPQFASTAGLSTSPTSASDSSGPVTPESATFPATPVSIVTHDEVDENRNRAWSNRYRSSGAQSHKSEKTSQDCVYVRSTHKDSICAPTPTTEHFRASQLQPPPSLHLPPPPTHSPKVGPSRNSASHPSVSVRNRTMPVRANTAPRGKRASEAPRLSHVSEAPSREMTPRLTPRVQFPQLPLSPASTYSQQSCARPQYAPVAEGDGTLTAQLDQSWKETAGRPVSAFHHVVAAFLQDPHRGVAVMSEMQPLLASPPGVHRDHRISALLVQHGLLDVYRSLQYDHTPNLPSKDSFQDLIDHCLEPSSPTPKGHAFANVCSKNLLPFCIR